MYLVANIEIPDDFIKNVEKMMFEFMWNGPDKISRATMYAEYADGGLKFPNLRCMIETQLVKWIHRYMTESDHNWKILFDHYCKRFGGNLIFMSNYCIKHLQTLGMPAFYRSMLLAWSKTKEHYQFADQESQLSILNQLVWNNQFILLDSKSFYCKALHEAGLRYVYHIFDRYGNIVKFDYWREKGVSSKYCMKYLAIVSAVKKKWGSSFSQILLQMVLEKNDYEEQFALLISEIQKLKTRNVYINFVNEYVTRPVCERLFSVQYGIQEDEWSQIYQLPFQCTIEVKMRVFQFKLTHNILYTNDKLFKMRQVDTNLCTFCETAIETPVHIFCECKSVADLRQAFVDKFGLNLGITFEDLTKKRMIFGFIKDWKGPYKQLLNHLVILLKRYIYIQRCKKSELSLGGLLAFISSVRYTESVIAKQKLKENVHYRKWSPVENVF